MAQRKKQGKGSAGRKGFGRKKGQDRSAIFWVAGAVFLAMAYVYWQNAGVVNQTAEIERKIAPTLKTFDIKEKDLQEQKVEKKKIENKRYVHKQKVYAAPKELSLAGFETKLKKDLDKTPFKVAKAKRETTKDTESYHATINYGKYDVMDIKVVKPRPTIVTPPPPPKPPPAKRVLAKVAIVLDDWGYTMNNVPVLAEIREPITLAVLPGLPHSVEVARGATARGYEVILHLPLEATRESVAEEADTIKAGMSSAAVNARLAKELRSAPGAVGVNNHQGSKGTSERETMSPIMGYLKRNNLFFLDSMTTAKSVCRDAASDAGVAYARRDVFLDNSSKISDIEKQFEVLKQTALKKGRAIGIGHDRRNTLIALRRMLPKLKDAGIKIVPVSELVK